MLWTGLLECCTRSHHPDRTVPHTGRRPVTRQLQGAFAQIAAATGVGAPPAEGEDASAAGAMPKSAEPAAAAAEGKLDAASGSAAPVQNLGVVGRGTKRIKLQPLQVGGSAAGGQATAEGWVCCCRARWLLGLGGQSLVT